MSLHVGNDLKKETEDAKNVSIGVEGEGGCTEDLISNTVEEA